MRRSVVIEVKIIDADTLGEIAYVAKGVHVDDDLLSRPFPDGAQNMYSAYVADLGTEAYRKAFPRK